MKETVTTRFLRDTGSEAHPPVLTRPHASIPQVMVEE